MAVNYAVGVFVYRGYVRALKESSVICVLNKTEHHLSGSITVESRWPLELVPIDYQVYFYDKDGKLVQTFADSFRNSSTARFDAESSIDLSSENVKIIGISNVRVKWLWINEIVPLPIEVKLP